MEYEHCCPAAAAAALGHARFFDIAAELEGCISLGVGEPDSNPWHPGRGHPQPGEKGKTTYTAQRGPEERQEIVAMQRRFGLRYEPLKEEVLK